MFGKIVLSLVFVVGLLCFYIARKIADKFFGGKDEAVIAIKVICGVIVVACAILAVYV